MEKNINAIDKIIKKLSFRDYQAAARKYPKSYALYNAGATSRKPRGFYPFSYNLGTDTMEALEIKKDYLQDKITEEEYKAYCLRFNLLEA